MGRKKLCSALSLGSFSCLIIQATGDRGDQQEEIMKFSYVQTYEQVRDLRGAEGK